MRTNLFKRGVLLLALVLFYSQSYAGRCRVKTLQFSAKFLEEMETANLNSFDCSVFISGYQENLILPQYLDESKVSTIHFSSSNATCNLPNPKWMNFDSSSPERHLYYYLVSKNFVVAHGVGNLTGSMSNGILEIDPLVNCNKITLKPTIGRDGKPVTTFFKLHPAWGENDCYIRNGLMSATIELKQPEPGSSAAPVSEAFFWTDLASVPYVVASEGPYFLQSDVCALPKDLSGTSICLDYRQAKQVNLSVKDINGVALDMRKLKDSQGYRCDFQSKFGTGHSIYEEQSLNINFRMEPVYPEGLEPLPSLAFYAFPGNHIVSFWNNSHDRSLPYPGGLEGFLNVNETDAVQEAVLDYSQYITLNLNGNMHPDFTGLKYVFKNPQYKGGNNKLTECFVFDYHNAMITAYTRTIPGVTGNTAQVKIWPAVNATSAVIDGRVHAAPVHAETADFHQNGTFDVNVPDLHKVQIKYPSLLKNYVSTLMVDNLTKEISYKKSNNPTYRPGDFTKMETLVTYMAEGTHQASLVAKEFKGYNDRDDYQSPVHTFEVTNQAALTEVTIPWHQAVLFHSEGKGTSDILNYVSWAPLGEEESQVFDTRYVSDLDQREALFFFDKPGSVLFELDTQNSDIGNLFRVDVGEGLNIVQAAEAPQNVVDLTVKDNFANRDDISFGFKQYFNEAGDHISIYPKPQNEKLSYSVPAGKLTGELCVKLQNRDVMYDLGVDVSENAQYALQVDNVSVPVKFTRDNEDLMIYGSGDKCGKVKIYCLNEAPFATGALVRTEFYSKTLTLLPGKYRAVDELNNEIYFEIDNKSTSYEFDFTKVEMKEPSFETGKLLSAEELNQTTGHRRIAIQTASNYVPNAHFWYDPLFLHSFTQQYLRFFDVSAEFEWVEENGKHYLKKVVEDGYLGSESLSTLVAASAAQEITVVTPRKDSKEGNTAISWSQESLPSAYDAHNDKFCRFVKGDAAGTSWISPSHDTWSQDATAYSVFYVHDLSCYVTFKTVFGNQMIGLPVGSKVATFSAPYAVEVPQGVQAYYVKSADVDAASVTLSPIEGVIPAHQGVVLVSTQDHVLMPATQKPAPVLEKSALLGTAELAMTMQSGDYVLGTQKTATQFYAAVPGSVLKLNKAFLRLPAGMVGSLKVHFEGESTGIEEMETSSAADAPIYDLSGRRVLHMVKGGIYIQNGKKFIK